jgi:hypothetical protein
VSLNFGNPASEERQPRGRRANARGDTYKVEGASHDVGFIEESHQHYQRDT